MRTAFSRNWWIGVLPEFGGSGAEHVAEFGRTKMGPKWLRDGRRQRIESQIRWLMPELLDGRRRRVLDVGCGTGGHLAAIRWLGHDVAGVDRTGSHFRTLNEHIGVEIPEFTIGTDERLPFADGEFDLIYSIEVLIRRSFTPAIIRSAMAEMARVIKPGGAILTGWWDRDVRAPWRADYVPAGFTAERIEWEYNGTTPYFFMRCRRES